MRQFKYSIEDIFNNYTKYGILLIQIVVSLLIFCISISIIIDYKLFISNINRISNTSNIYSLVDATEAENFDMLVNSEDEIKTIKKAQTLYEYIKSGYNSYTFRLSYQKIFQNGVDSSFLYDQLPDTYQTLTVDKKFTEFFSLNCCLGHIFDDSDYDNNNSNLLIPVILGYDYKDYYTPGNIIDNKYVVKGILNKSSFYLNPLTQDRGLLYLDKIILFPLQSNQKYDSFFDYVNLIFNTVIVNCDMQELQNIQKLSNELNLFTFKFQSFKYRIDNIISATSMELQLYSTITITILTFSIISIVCNLFEYLSKYTKEFAVHIMCGGTIKSIANRIITQIFIIIFICDLIILIIMKPSLSYLITVIFSIIIGIAIIAFPLLKLKNTSITKLLKRS